MGADGGTIPTRGELVRLKKKPETKDKISALASKWKLCLLSQQPLLMPIVACQLGRLYNKENILELLLDRSTFENTDTTYYDRSNTTHIRSLKDVHELNLTDNPAYKTKSSDMGYVYIDHNISPYICPVTGLEMSGKYRFVFLATCSCVFSERVLKEIPSETCHKCAKPFTEKDVVILNGTEDDVDVMKANMAERKLKAKLEKKAKKKKHVEVAGEAGTSSGILKSSETVESEGASASKKVRISEEVPSTSTEPVIKQGKGIGGDKKGARPKKATTKATTIQEDPTASKAYKELFNTCPRAKNQMKAHWVTCDPCHF